VAVAAGAVIVTCVTVPASFLARFLSLSGLVFIGRISYGLYLYHWPLFLVIDHAHTGLAGGWLLGARLVVTFAAATASFFLIEEPIRTADGPSGVGRVWALGAAAVVTAWPWCWPPWPLLPAPPRPPRWRALEYRAVPFVGRPRERSPAIPSVS
jgi:peptidoglycan/LPS O-acetylase OafA/YrhL